MKKQTKDATVQMRIARADRDAWLEAAGAEQMALSQWIRRRCNGLPAAAPKLKGAR